MATQQEPSTTALSLIIGQNREAALRVSTSLRLQISSGFLADIQTIALHLVLQQFLRNILIVSLGVLIKELIEFLEEFSGTL